MLTVSNNIEAIEELVIHLVLTINVLRCIVQYIDQNRFLRESEPIVWLRGHPLCLHYYKFLWSEQHVTLDYPFYRTIETFEVDKLHTYVGYYYYYYYNLGLK